jgi:hypothetical protein
MHESDSLTETGPDTGTTVPYRLALVAHRGEVSL